MNLSDKEVEGHLLMINESNRSFTPLRSINIFAYRTVLKAKHSPITLIDFTAMPLLFLIMFTYLFGGAIAGSPTEYLPFLMPGILVQSVIQISMYSGLALCRDIQKGFFNRQKSLPIWAPSYLIGMMIIDIFRYLIAVILVISVSYLIGFRPEAGISGLFYGIVLLLWFASCFSWIWSACAFLLKDEGSLTVISTMIVLPLIFLSSAIVDTDTMPTIIQYLIRLNPISILIESVRGLIHGVPEMRNILITLFISILIVSIFAPLTILLYNKKE